MIARYLINLYFSHLITFFMTLLLAFLFLQCFRIKNPRLRYYTLLLPFFKLLWDLCQIAHPSWVFLHNESVFNQPTDSRIISVSLFYNWIPGCAMECRLKDDLLFSIGDVLYEAIGPLWTALFAYTLLSLTFFFVMKKTCALLSMGMWIQRLKGHQIPLKRGIDDEELQKWLKRKNIALLETDLPISSPFVIGIIAPSISLPSTLLQSLSQKEMEAMIFHEISHIRWHDNLVNFFVMLMEGIFWFLPFKRKILALASHQREVSCDASHVNSFYMARALQKSLLLQKERAPYSLVMFSKNRSKVKKRIEKLLTHHRIKNNWWKRWGYFSLFLGISTMTLFSHFFPF
jgi:Zn-dependent protease with chaperone function